MPNQPKIVMFSTPTCSWCRRAKQYFQEQRLKFKEIDVSKDPSAANELRRVSGQTGVPVILINNKPIVGFDVNKINRLLGVR